MRSDQTHRIRYKRRQQSLILLLTCLLPFQALKLMAQIPSTEIYLSTISKDEGGSYKFSKPVNITNREGYDNQPSFFTGDKILYTVLSDSLGGTDTYLYDPGKNKRTRVTHTAESEYSPTLIPGSKSFSVVRVDTDSAQRLYQVTPDGKGSKLLLKNQDSIGYHCWLSGTRLALFILGEPPSLVIADINSRDYETVASGIGRCLARIPGTNQLSFVDKSNEKEWYIKVYDPETKKTAHLVKTLEGSEDYAWMPDKKLLMSKESKLYISDPYRAQGWKEIADFSNSAGQIYRIALNESGTRLAMVSYKGKKP